MPAQPCTTRVLNVRLFGRFDASYDRQTLHQLESTKALELFCYLLVYRQRAHARDALAGLLWGDRPTPQAKRYLRKALWQVQNGWSFPQSDRLPPLLLAEPDWVRLNPETRLWLDAAEFEGAHDRVQGVPGRDLTPKLAGSLEQAVELYTGDLLEGWYQDWCLFERQRLQHAYLGMLDKLMGYCEANDECEKGLVYGNLILRYDRARERTHQRLMRLHYQNRDRTAALRQYQQCAAALHEELSVRPSRRTTALHQQIQADQLPAHPGQSASPSAYGVPAAIPLGGLPAASKCSPRERSRPSEAAAPNASPGSLWEESQFQPHQERHAETSPESPEQILADLRAQQRALIGAIVQMEKAICDLEKALSNQPNRERP
jgi:DNA-binding SARP family transcriptional activator